MENNNPKKKRSLTIIIIVLVSLFLVGIFFVIFYKPVEKSPAPINVAIPEEAKKIISEKESLAAEPVVEIPVNQEELVVYEFDEQKEAAREVTAEDLKQIAFAFAERFGSYSNQANYGNIEDLKMYMTKEMRIWAENFVIEQKETPYVGYYYGITTKALVGEISEFDTEDAEILVSTRRQEVKDDQTTIFDQNIVVNFYKIDSDWKVGSAYWQ